MNDYKESENPKYPDRKVPSLKTRIENGIKLLEKSNK